MFFQLGFFFNNCYNLSLYKLLIPAGCFQKIWSIELLNYVFRQNKIQQNIST